MIGFDLQEVARIKDAQKLLDRISTENEKAYIQKFGKDFNMKVASLWAVKEAAFKALDMKNGLSFKSIELCHKDNGCPYLKFYGEAKKRLDELQAKNVYVSISHQPNVVGAVVQIY